MRIPFVIIFFVALLPFHNAVAQQDTAIVSMDTIKIKEIRPKGKRIYDPDRAALLSAIVPGLGQAYNGHYWKVPIIYGGIGVLYYFFRKNNADFRSYRNSGINYANPDAHLYVDPKVKKRIEANGNPPSYLGRAQSGERGSRRLRDLTIIISCASYGIIIAEAYVSAHLKGFTITKDLSLKVTPSIEPTLGALPATGIAFNFQLK